MLSDDHGRGAQPPETAAADDALVVDEGEELVPRSRVNELVATAEKSGRDAVFAESRRLFQKLLAEKTAALEAEKAQLIAKHEAEKATLVAEVAEATRDLIRSQKGT